MKPIALAGFAAKFAAEPDPWRTWSDADEALKRSAVLSALPAGKVGRLLELGAGNGSNSRSLARRALRLDATEATAEGTALVRQAVAPFAPRARALRLVVPGRPPRPLYDAIVIAELLYYLSPLDMARLARHAARILRPGGTLVLAHHRKTFYDFAQQAEGIHQRFLDASEGTWRCRAVRRTRRWSVLRCRAGA